MKLLKLKSNSGFTLIELFIVAAIIISIGGIAVMNFASYTLKHDTESDIKQLYADLMKARALAITQSRTVQIVFSDAKAYSLATDLNEDGNFNDPEEILDQASLKRGVSWNGSSAQGVQIAFSPKGFVASNGTFSVNVPDAEYNCIRVFATRINFGKLSGGQCEAK